MRVTGCVWPVCVCVLCVCVLCVCLVRLPFVRLFLCWQEKHFPQIIDYQNYIKNATKKRERERERERGDRLGRAARIFLGATSYSPLNCPRTCHAYLLLLAGPSLQQSDRIDCNNAINVMNVRAGIYIQLLHSVYTYVNTSVHACACLCVCVCVPASESIIWPHCCSPSLSLSVGRSDTRQAAPDDS